MLAHGHQTIRSHQILQQLRQKDRDVSTSFKEGLGGCEGRCGSKLTHNGDKLIDVPSIIKLVPQDLHYLILELPDFIRICLLLQHASTNLQEYHQFLLLGLIKGMELDMLTQIVEERTDSVPVDMATPIDLDLATDQLDQLAVDLPETAIETIGATDQVEYLSLFHLLHICYNVFRDEFDAVEVIVGHLELLHL